MNIPRLKYLPKDRDEIEDIIRCAKNQYIIQNISYKLISEESLEGWFIYIIYDYSIVNKVEKLYIHKTNDPKYKIINSDTFYRILILNEYAV